MRNLCLLIFLAFMSGIFFSCANNNNTENTETDSIINETKIEDEIEESDEEESAETALEQKLNEIIKNNKEQVFEQLNGLKKAIANQNEMKSLNEVEKALKMRDSLVYLLNNTEEFYTYMEEGDRFYEEFEVLGIQIVEAEGMFGMLDQATIFEKIIEKVADEPYILFNKIKNLNASSHGSEYPFFDITEEMEIIPLAEKMITRYPGHKYNKEIIKMLNYALYPLTDLHKAPEDFAQYIVGGYDVNAYPGATDISYHNSFVEKYKNSRFAKVIEKIIENPSALETREFDLLYLVEVPGLDLDSVFTDEKFYDELKKLPEDLKQLDDGFKYMWLGIDIPHTLTLRDGDENRSVLVYRFFDKKEPAVKALKKIQKIIPKAELVEYKLTETDKKYRN